MNIPNDLSELDSRDERIGLLIEAYLNALQEGREIDVSELLKNDPDLELEVREQIELLGDFDTIYEEKESFSAPKDLGDFIIQREIGRGGMAVVYEADQLSLNRRVALKVLPLAGALDGRQLERFRNEARAAAQLHHPNIVPVHAVGQERGVHYYAMQFIDGLSLSQALKEFRDQQSSSNVLTPNIKTRTASSSSPTTPKSTSTDTEKTSTSIESNTYYQVVAQLFAQAAEALEYAHQVGVIHRDVKPANLLLENGTHLWVADFGLALMQEDSGLTRSGELLGTLAYMSPEQTQGHSALIDHRTDIYSLGVSLYELLTLQRPFQETSKADLITRIRNEDPTPPRQLRPGIPLDLETIVLKSIEKEAKDRYPSMAELARDLKAYLEHRPIQARRMSVRERAWRWFKRNTMVASLTIIISLLLLSLAGSLWIAQTINTAKESAEYSEAKANIYELLSRSRALRTEQRPGRKQEALQILKGASQQLKNLSTDDSAIDDIKFQLRNELIAWSSTYHANLKTKWPKSILKGRFIKPSPDFEHLAVILNPHKIHIYEQKQTKPRVELKLPSLDAIRCFFSPTGSYLLIQSYGKTIGNRHWGGFQLWDWANETLLLQSEDLHLADSYGFSLEGNKLLLTKRENRQLYLTEYSLDLGRESSKAPLSRLPNSIAYSPDSQEVIITVGNGYQKSKFPWIEEPEVKSFSDSPHIHHAEWSPDGSRIALSTSNAKIFVLNPETEEPLFMSMGHQNHVIDVRFHPLGHLLASTSWDSTTRLYDAYSGELKLTLNGPSYRNSEWSPDGTELGFSHNQGQMYSWEIEPPTILKSMRFVSHWQGDSSRITTNQNGTLCATSHIQTGIKIWSTLERKLLAELPLKSFTCPRFNPFTGDLITIGTQGAFLWPITSDEQGKSIIGPPRRDPLPINYGGAGNSSQDGRYVAAFNNYRSVEFAVSDLKTGKTYKIDRMLSQNGAISNKGEIAGQVSLSREGAGLFTLSSLDGSQRFPQRKIPFGFFEFSPDGSLLALSVESALLVYRVEDLKNEPEDSEVQPFWIFPKEGNLYLKGSPHFSSDGKILADFLTKDEIVFLDITTRKKIFTFKLPDSGHVSEITFSPNNREVFIGTTNSAVRILSLDKLNEILDSYGVGVDLNFNEIESPPSIPIKELVVLKGFDSPATQRDDTDDETLKFYQTVVARNPSDAWSHYQLGILKSFRKNYKEAIVHYNRCLELESKLWGAYRHRSIAHERLKNFPEAIADAKEVLKAPKDYHRNYDVQRVPYLVLEASKSKLLDAWKGKKDK